MTLPGSAAPVGLSAQTKGMLCMIAGVLVLTTQDAISKWLTSSYHVGEIMVYRGVISFLPLLVFIYRDGGVTVLRSRRPGLNFLRALLALATSLLIVLSFAALPLAETLAIVFASPLILTALSVPLLGETVGLRRWIAVAVGFVGVLVLTRPGPQGIALVALLPLSASLCSALRDIVTRALGKHDSSTTILFHTQLLGTLAALPSLYVNNGWPPLHDWLLFGAAVVLVTVAHYLMIQAYIFSAASAVAPFRYLALVWAVLVGYLVWGDVPDAWAVAGSCLIAGSGLYMLGRGARRSG